MIRKIQDKIIELKKEKDFCILAHSYVAKEITEIADSVGDSYKLSVDAKKVENKNILFCGVHFMAETAKILSPNKKVILANPNAGCPMAEQFTVNEVKNFREKNPDHAVVCYVNTTAALKCVSDVCVTSACAVDVVKNIKNKNILFIPDKNLGSYVKERCPEKNIILWDGGCPIHSQMTEQNALDSKKLHPNALLLVHPECPADVCKHADYIGSTSGIMKYAQCSDSDEFIIGTEISIVELLEYQFPEKNFYAMNKGLICSDMKETTLIDVYKALQGKGGLEIEMDEATISSAFKCIDAMIKLS